MAIAGDIVVGIAADAIGIIFGFGILKMQRWAWMANVVYNIIFTLLSVDAFAENCSTPRFISRYSERDPAFILLSMPTTCVYILDRHKYHKDDRQFYNLSSSVSTIGKSVAFPPELRKLTVG